MLLEGIGVANLETDPDSGLSLGTAISGTPGSGKTTLAAVLALWGLLRGYGQLLLDPTGSLSTAFLHQVLCFLREFPDGEDGLLWQKVRYIPVGAIDSVSFPIYYRREGESVWEASERLLRVIELSRPNLISQSSVTWPRAKRLASNAGAVLTSLGLQLTEVEDLLFNMPDWEKQGLFTEAIARCPEAKSAVAYFRTEYQRLSRADKYQATSTFLDHVHRLYQDPKLRLLFGGNQQGINWEETLEQKRQTVILDFSHITDPEARRFALLWIFHSLYPHIKTRGRRTYPMVLLVDEFAAAAHKAEANST